MGLRCPTILPGHFVVDDLLALRFELHSKGICPKVQLNGKGIPKALRVRQQEGDVVIHKRAPEAFNCEAFAAAFQRKTKRDLVYSGESLASFWNHAFVELLKPPPTRTDDGESARNHLAEAGLPLQPVRLPHCPGCKERGPHRPAFDWGRR